AVEPQRTERTIITLLCALCDLCGSTFLPADYRENSFAISSRAARRYTDRASGSARRHGCSDAGRRYDRKARRLAIKGEISYGGKAAASDRHGRARTAARGREAIDRRHDNKVRGVDAAKGVGYGERAGNRIGRQHHVDLCW